MLIDRRRMFLASGALGFSFLTACKSIGGSGAAKLLATSADVGLVIRRKWQQGVANDWQNQYIAAVTWFKANDGMTFESTDPRSYLSWSKIIDIHNTACTHGSQNLLPWHRLYLAYFESACQFALNDPTFAIPYWDWSEQRSIPNEFYEVDILKADRGLLKGATLSEEVCGQAVVDKLIALDDFNAFHGLLRITAPWLKAGKTHFGGQFESGPHNGVHNGVGGIMANPLLSPTDPVFWLHHSNIDRLWALWQSQHAAIAGNTTEAARSAGGMAKPEMETGAKLAVDGRWNTTTCVLVRKGTDAEGTIAATPLPPASSHRESIVSMTNGNLVDFKAMGYTFDSQAKAGSQSNVAIKAIERVYSNLEGTDRSIQDGILRTDFSAASTGFQELLAKFTANGSSRVMIAAGKLPFPDSEDLRKTLILRVFALVDGEELSAEDMAAKDAFKRPEYLGFYSFFTLGHHAMAEDQNTIAAEFDVTTVLRTHLKSAVPKKITVLAAPFNLKTNAIDRDFLKSSVAELVLSFGIAQR